MVGHQGDAMIVAAAIVPAIAYPTGTFVFSATTSHCLRHCCREH